MLQGASAALPTVVPPLQLVGLLSYSRRRLIYQATSTMKMRPPVVCPIWRIQPTYHQELQELAFTRPATTAIGIAT